MGAALFGYALFGASHAAARDQLQGVFEGAVGYTDNVFSSPDEPVPDVPPKTADFMAIVSPSAVYGVGQANEVHRFSYTVTGNLFLDNGSANSFGNRAEWEGFFALSPRTELVMTGALAQDQAHTSNTFLDTSRTAVRALFPGTSSFAVAHLEELLSHEISFGWRARQASGVSSRVPLFGDAGPASVGWTHRAGIERVWRIDALGPEARAEYWYAQDVVTAEGEPLGNQSLLILGALLRWRHDYGRYFSSYAEAGVVHADILTRGGGGLYPAGGAGILYGRRDAEASLTYARTVSTDLYLAQTFLSHEVALRGGLPLDEDAKFWVRGSAGYRRGRLLESSGDLATEVDVAVADAGLLWKLEDELHFSLRYQHIEQISGAELPPLPLSFVRNIVMVGARFTIPRDEELPRPYREPRKIDRTDEVREELEDGPTTGATPVSR